MGRGDEVLVVHRGVTEPADLPPCVHVHADRHDFASAAAWARLILDAAGPAAEATELVTVPDDALPEDLRITRAHPQHLIVSSAKALTVLGWKSSDSAAGLASSVPWHLENPPAEGDAPDFSADDAALAAV